MLDGDLDSAGDELVSFAKALARGKCLLLYGVLISLKIVPPLLSK